MKNIEKSVTLFCPTCGNDQFETLDEIQGEIIDADESVRFKCSDCGLIITKGELIEENQDVINANIEDMKEEVVQEFQKELNKVLKKWK